ncbi:MAG: hypothetical protein R3F24_02985 [Gammaproteobacteria bacterium]
MACPLIPDLVWGEIDDAAHLDRVRTMVYPEVPTTGHAWPGLRYDIAPMNGSRIPAVRLALFSALAGLAPDAHAYLDPSTGSMILSAIVGIFAMALTVKTYWYKLKRLVSGQGHRHGAGASEGRHESPDSRREDPAPRSFASRSFAPGAFHGFAWQSDEPRFTAFIS